MMRLLKRRSTALPASVPADATLQPGRNVFVARCDGAAVLLDLKSEVYFGLDDVADAIWRGIESGRTVREIAAGLSEEYNAGAKQGAIVGPIAGILILVAIFLMTTKPGA